MSDKHFFPPASVCQMAKMAAAKVELGGEKKDICILVELVAGIGLSFDDLKKLSK